jgi:hypothetical protein
MAQVFVLLFIFIAEHNTNKTVDSTKTLVNNYQTRRDYRLNITLSSIMNLFNGNDVRVLETGDYVQLSGEELVEKVLGCQVVIDNLDGKFSSTGQVQHFPHDGKRSLAEFITETISILEEHGLKIDGTFHVRHLGVRVVLCCCL